MSDDYLWNRSGARDPEIEKLERLLAPYRCPPRRKSLPLRIRPFLAVAATLLLITAVTFLMSRRSVSDWRIAGDPVRIGQTIQTNQRPANLEAEFVGQVELAPNSRLRVLASRGGAQQLALQRGTLHALIWAPPSRFVVETPSAKAIDLGCSYTLRVLDDDSGLLTVQTGWVAFQAGRTESFIPAGAACRTRVQLGPGLPYFEDAASDFRAGVEQFDATQQREGLSSLLAAARTRDALTLWHLIGRTQGPDRNRVVQRFASLVPGVDSSGLNAGSTSALDHAWEQLGLGGADWWRTWKHNWPARP